MNKSKLCMPLVFGAGFALAADPPLVVGSGILADPKKVTTTAILETRRSEGACCKTSAATMLMTSMSRTGRPSTAWERPARVLMDNLSGGVYTAQT